jgi:hypothetical protein
VSGIVAELCLERLSVADDASLDVESWRNVVPRFVRRGTLQAGDWNVGPSKVTPPAVWAGIFAGGNIFEMDLLCVGFLRMRQEIRNSHRLSSGIAASSLSIVSECSLQ